MKSFNSTYWRELGDLGNYKAYAGFGCPDMFTPSITLVIFEQVRKEAKTKRVAVITLNPFKPRVDKLFDCATEMPQRKTDSKEIFGWIEEFTGFHFPTFFLISRYGKDNGYFICDRAITGLEDGKAHYDFSREHLHDQLMRARPLNVLKIPEEDRRPLDIHGEQEEFLLSNLNQKITEEGLEAMSFSWHAACGFHYSEPVLSLESFKQVLKQLFI